MSLSNQYWEFGLFVFLNAGIILFLALNISRVRIQKRIPYGDGGDKDANQAIRAHANGIEHVLIYGLNILALCFFQVSELGLQIMVLGFTVGRIVHAYGMLARNFTARRLGALASYLFEAVGIVWLAICLFS